MTGAAGPSQTSTWQQGAIVLAVSAAMSFLAVAALSGPPVADAVAGSKSDFVRPAGIPASGRAMTDAQIALGRSLFEDGRLSASGDMSCSSCHKPLLAFTDGVARGKGKDGVRLARHTPQLWNLAWGETFFWDGRARTLEEQARGPIENPAEMAAKLPDVVTALAADSKSASEFAAAFPLDPRVTEDNVLGALGAYVRTLVSPVTRFDRWVAGDATALTAGERAGFAVFTGKAGCVACHSGWRFSDEAFHDIGLPGDDLGRGAAIGLAAADHAFKTPSLRELGWTAPYMHDGSLASLEAVLDHYASIPARRPTLSKDLPPLLVLDAGERGQLMAFLRTLSSDTAPKAPSQPPRIETAGTPPGPLVATTHVGQKDKRYWPDRVSLQAGESLTILNDDTRTHNVRIDDPRMRFTSNAQEPGDQVIIGFPDAGTFRVTCSIHPAMHLDVQVEKK